MNKLSVTKRAQILTLLVEGMSLRAISRATDASINTISNLLVDAGEACSIYHDETVRRVRAKRVQVDETLELHLRQAEERPVRQGRPA